MSPSIAEADDTAPDIFSAIGEYFMPSGSPFGYAPDTAKGREISRRNREFAMGAFESLIGGPELKAAEGAIGAVAGLAKNRVLGGAETALRPALPAFASSGEREAAVQAKAAAKAASRYVVKDNAVVNTVTGMTHSTHVSPDDATGVAQRLNAIPDVPAQGLGGTGGQAPLPPKGPKFSGDQFPSEVKPGLNAIRRGKEVVKARPKITLAQQQQIADRQADKPLGSLIQDLRLAGPGTTSGKTIEVGRRVAGMIQESGALLDRMQSGVATNADRAEFAVAIKAALLGESSRVGAISEAARVTGAQGRHVIEAKLRPKDVKLLDAVRAQADRVLADPARADEFARQIIIASANPKKLDALIGAASQLPFWKRVENGFFEYYRANVLWNVATHVTNATSGIFQTAEALGESLIANPKNVRHLPEVGKGYLQSAASVLPSKAQNWLSAHVGIFEDLAEQIQLTNFSDKYGGLNVGAHAIPGPIGSAIRTPFRVLAASDVFQVKPLYNYFLKTEAEVLGKKAGLRGKALRDFVENIPPDSFDQIQEKALSQAHEVALHSSSDLSRAILALREASVPVKLMTLFVNTPINLAKRGIRYSPLGAARAIPAVFTEGGRDNLPKIARETLIGSGIMAGFMALMGSDNMTGLSPKTAAERALWEAEGRQPMSIRATEYPLLRPLLEKIYGDKASTTWVSVNLMGPLLYPALIAGAVAEMGESGREVTGEHALAAAGAAGQTILNTLPLFSQYASLNNLISNPSLASAGALAANFLKPLIPAETGLAMVERMTDGLKRDPKDIKERLQGIIPGLGQQIREDLDVLGRTIPVQTGVAGMLPKATTENPSPILAEDRRLRDANVGWSGLNFPQQTFGSGDNQIRLDEDQYKAYQKIAGVTKEKLLTELMVDPKYQAMSDVEKAKAFDRAEKQAQDSALRAYGIGLTNSRDIAQVVAGARLAIYTGDRYQQAKSLAAIGPRLTPEVIRSVDRARTQTDPSKPSYDPTVAELLRGNELVTAWLRAPEFSIGTKPQWDAAASAAEQLRRLNADSTRRGADPSTDPNITRFYTSAAGGWLALLYGAGGSKRSTAVSPARQAIQQDRLWGLFSSAAGSAERPLR